MQGRFLKGGRGRINRKRKRRSKKMRKRRKRMRLAAKIRPDRNSNLNKIKRIKQKLNKIKHKMRR